MLSIRFNLLTTKASFGASFLVSGACHFEVLGEPISNVLLFISFLGEEDRNEDDRQLFLFFPLNKVGPALFHLEKSGLLLGCAE